MTVTRRDFVAATGATAATALLSRASHAHSFPFTPNQRYPDPAIQVLDSSFAKSRTARHSMLGGRSDSFSQVFSGAFLNFASPPSVSHKR